MSPELDNIITNVRLYIEDITEEYYFLLVNKQGFLDLKLALTSLVSFISSFVLHIIYEGVKTRKLEQQQD